MSAQRDITAEVAQSEYLRLRNLLRLIERIRNERPDLWQQIREFAKGKQ